MYYPVDPYSNYTTRPPYYPGQPTQDQMSGTMRQGQMQQTLGQLGQSVQPAPLAPAPVDDRIWVQGELAATACPVTANGFVRLWDSTAPVFYHKRADAQGKPFPLEIYDYKRRGGEPMEQVQPSNYEDRLKAIEDRLSAMEKSRSAWMQKEDES